VLTLVHAAQRRQRARAQTRCLGDLLEQPFGAVEQARAQIVLRQRKQRLLAVLGRKLLARQQVLMDADGALHLAAAAVQRAEREVRLDGVGARIQKLQEHVEGAVRLLGDEVVEACQVVGMELAEAPGPALAPAEVAGEHADHQRGHDQEPGE
jgi:hypothetical protein